MGPNVVVDWKWFVGGLVRTLFCITQNRLGSSAAALRNLNIVYSIHAIPKDQVPGKRQEVAVLKWLESSVNRHWFCAFNTYSFESPS